MREFEEAATLELERRNIFRAEQVCAVNEGAEWCQSFVAYHRPDAVCILEQPHAFEHVAKAGRAVFGKLAQVSLKAGTNSSANNCEKVIHKWYWTSWDSLVR